MSLVAHRQMVTLAREAKGWSQRELAEKAGVSQGFLSKVENGLLDLHGEQLEAVAAALDAPVALLVDDTPIRGLEVTCLHHRRRHSKMTAATKRQIEAVTHLTRITVEGLLHGIELIPEAQLRRIDIDEVTDPAEIARRLRVAWRIPTGPIPNITALLEAVGIVVVQRPLGTNAQDAVTTWPHEQDRPPVMLVNTGLPTDRYRFTVAHELGHLVMHQLPRETQEAEANTFASEFLAPAEDITPQLVGLTTRDFPRLMELKQQWGMSIAALIRRAKDLGQISDRQYREFQVQLGRLGWKRVEPGNLPPEGPQTLRRVIDTHRSEHHYSPDELAHAAVMTTPAFMRHYLEPQRTTATGIPLTWVRL